MGKLALGRGLGQLLESHGAVRPSDGTAIEERPAAALGLGVRTLIAPVPTGRTPTPDAPDPGPGPASEPPADSGPGPVFQGAASGRAVPGELDSDRVTVRRLVFGLLAADVVLCLAGAALLCARVSPDQDEGFSGGLLTGVGVAAIGVAAWLSCEAYLLHQRSAEHARGGFRP